MDATDTGGSQEAVSAFLGYLRRRGHPVGTQRQYGRYLNLFAQWAGDREPDAITAREIELDYLGQWHDEWERKNGRAPSDNTMRNHIQALRALYGADRPRSPQGAIGWARSMREHHPRCVWTVAGTPA
ncbi:hypothetical protein BH18ACT14_BH18ACT14_06940 [soil metagenome]